MAKPKTQDQEQDQVIEELRERLAMVEADCRSLRARLGDHDSRISEMEIAKPPELRRLALDAVVACIEADPYARFEVLKDWRVSHHELLAGSVIRADHIKNLPDFVRSGLMLGVPTDQAAVIAKMRTEANARADAALAETHLANSAAERAEASAAAARAAAANIGHEIEIDF